MPAAIKRAIEEEVMKCVANTHYSVIRKTERFRGKHYAGDIISLTCQFCSFAVYKRYTSKPRSSKSGLGRYNKMRGQMVKHLHEQHREALNSNPPL